MNYSVPVSALPLLQDPPFVAALTLLATALGRRSLRIIRAPISQLVPAEKGVLAASLGFGILQFVPFVLGMAGVLTSANLLKSLYILGALGILIGLLIGDIRAVVRSTISGVKSFRLPGDRWVRIVLVMCAIGLAVAFVRALAPPTDADGVAYHLQAPKLWLMSGSMYFIPVHPHVNSPMGVEMLYLIAMSFWSDTAAKLIHFTLGLLAFVGLWRLGVRFGSEKVAAGACALFLYAWPFGSAIALFGWAYIDLGYALQVVAALLAFRLWKETRQASALVLAGMLAGIGASYKLPGVVLCLAIAGWAAITLIRDGSGWKQAAIAKLQVILAGVLFYAPWLYRAWYVSGNPVYPFYASIFPTKGWDAEHSARFTEFFRYFNWGRGSWSDSIDLEQRKLILLVAAATVAIATFAIVRATRKTPLADIGAITGAVMILAIPSVGLYSRFYIPYLGPLYVLFLASLRGKPVLNRAAPLAVALGILAISAVLTVAETDIGGAIGRFTLDAKAVIAPNQRNDYLKTVFPEYTFIQEANHLMPGDKRVLDATVFLPGYYFKNELDIHDGYWIDASDWGAFLQGLKREQIRYLLVSESPYLRGGGWPLPGKILCIRRLVAEGAKEIARGEGLVLYEVTLP